MKTKLLITIFLPLFYVVASFAQDSLQLEPPARSRLDSLDLPASDSTELVQDSTSLLSVVESLPAGDSLSFPFAAKADVRYSKDSLDQEVESFAKDSMRYDIANKQLHLWGDAYVNYGDMRIEADYIVYNWTDNIVTATFSLDSLGHKKGLPKFSDKEQAFTAEKMRFNFKTHKGTVLKAVSNYNDLYVHGAKAKFFGAKADSILQDEHIYSKDALFTTCNHPDPHFGVRSRKQKVVPNKVVIVGPSNVEVGGVPTPLWLPFGFFPLKKGERTGLIFPRNYEYSDQLGFGLNGVGWYFPINDYINLSLTGKIYTRGSWGLTASSSYKKRYKYSGNFNLSYSDFKTENGIDIFSDRSFSFHWNHDQDPKAHPTNTFGGGIDIQTNNYRSRNFNDPNAALNNTLRSDLTFSKIFPDKPFTFSASMNHSQVNATRAVTITLPNLNFQMQRIYPFKSKDPLAKDKWYDKIGVTYSGQAQNRFESTDTTLFTQQTLDDARYGVKHRASTNASFRILKYFNLTPSANYTEVWHFKTLNRVFDPTPVVDTVLVDSVEMIYRYDTLQYGQVIEEIEKGFKPLRLFDASLSLNTKLFGLLQFKRGWLRGLRHTATPSISMSYRPDYTSDAWDYFRTVRTSTLDQDEDMYSIFQGGVYPDQPSSEGRSFNLNYGLNNIFEGKYFSKKDSTAHKFKIFEKVNMKGSYNFAADSLRFSTVKWEARTTLIPSISTLVLHATFDPYLRENDRRVNKLVWNERKRLLRFDRFSATFNTGFTIRKLVQLFSGEKQAGRNNQRPQSNTGSPGGVANESFLALIDNFRIRHNLKISVASIGQGNQTKDTLLIDVHSISLQGKLQLTDKWSLSLSNVTYNFKQKSLVYPGLTIYRDLHCWEMGMSWYPDRNVFSFFLHVKPGSLDFIKVPYGRNQFDGQFR